MTRAFTLAVLALTLLVPARSLAQRCEAPQVMLVVDRSSSMLGSAADGLSKWDAATMAIGDVTSLYEGRIQFGLSVFPYPDRCEPGDVMLDFGAHTAMDIVDALGAPPPAAGNWTPMSQTLDAIGAFLGPTAAGSHLVLVTDGWQWCSPYSATTRFDPVRSVEALHAAGITVHVVGFGAEVDALTLGRAAVAGGAPLPGCDPTISTPDGTGHCYAQVGDLSELRSALEAIGRSVTAEACNGLDDDCDGTIDEGFDLDADGASTCAGAGTPIDCDDSRASIHPGAPDTCNGVDDDCDGVIDPGCSCTDGQTTACGSTVGRCTMGTSTCTGGAYGSCEGAIEASPESCDGTDQDCDGTVDEDARCAEGLACHAGACIELVPAATPTPIAPATDEAHVSTDGGDGEYYPPSQRPGCACSAAGARGGATGGIALALGALAMIVARRRR